jgi:pSer/pThr/pTyr-binding forkhead associated (FHA) protein
VANPANNRPKILTQSSSEGLTETPVARRKSVLIGRGAHCDVVVKDAKASREHCRLTLEGAGFSLEDLGSRNGTYVDGLKIAQPTVLQVNQTFKIGDTIFYLA